jgi:hypothetical protein
LQYPIWRNFRTTNDKSLLIKTMTRPDIIERIAVKGADISALADQLIADDKQIPKLVEALPVEKSSKKYAYEKALRFVSERRPELVYSYFDIFCRMLDHENNFLKWGAIIIVANLTVVDVEKKFEAIFKKYYAPINGPTMVTAANIIGSSVLIARAKPALIDDIVFELLRVEKARFLLKGDPSPECRNVAIGHAIDSLDLLYNRIGNKAKIDGFVKRQLDNTRKQVVRKAEQFLRRHANS